VLLNKSGGRWLVGLAYGQLFGMHVTVKKSFFLSLPLSRKPKKNLLGIKRDFPPGVEIRNQYLIDVAFNINLINGPSPTTFNSCRCSGRLRMPELLAIL